MGQAPSSPGQWPRTRSPLWTGPVTPRVPEKGKLRANNRGLGPPPIGVRDLLAPVRTSHARRTSIPPVRGPGRHVSRGRGRESLAGRLAHPPHSMRAVEACSAAAARGAAIVRRHCRPHITEVHSAAACAAEPVCRIKWIRRPGTFPSYRLCRKLHGPFSYAAGNAASYTLTYAGLSTRQPCSQPLESTSNTTHSGRRVLCSGGPNHSKPAVFIVFLREIELVAS